MAIGWVVSMGKKSEIPDHRSMFEDCVAVHRLYSVCDMIE